MSSIYEMVNILIQSALTVFLLGQLLTPRLRYTVSALILTAGLSAVYLGTYFDHRIFNRAVSTVIRMAFITAYFVLAYRDSLRKKAGVFLLMMGIDTLAEISAALLTWSIYSVDSPYPRPTAIDPNALAMGRGVCLDVMFIGSLAAVMVYKRRYLNDRRSLRLLWLMLVFILTHLIFLVVFNCVCRPGSNRLNDWLQMAFQLMLFTNVLLYYAATLKINRLEKRAAELSLVSSEMERDREYFELADSRFEEISRIRHDIQNQLSAAKLLMSSEDGRQDAGEILRGISERLDRI